jgi:hypothetical protein
MGTAMEERGCLSLSVFGTCNFGGDAVGTSRLVGKDDLIKVKLEEGYSFRLLGRELGVSHQTLINYVKGLDRHYGKEREGLNFRKPLTPRDLAERHNVPNYVITDWIREGRIKGRKVGHRWVIIE